MKNVLAYKGYAAHIEFDGHDRVFFGRIAGINDIITFQGLSVDQLTTGFEEAVDDYLESCERLGVKPDKPYSGKLLLRMPAEVHAAVATAAQLHGKSINQWACEALSQATQAVDRNS